MIKNLRVDIIYNNTPADFEFEFNLGGYCRSRILNAKSANNKELVTKLAIAVSRSRVIIIVGELLGEHGTVAPVAKSISKDMVTVDHRQYHITSPEPISLIEGSLPLVTSDGEFGGCIIESGPQSIIFLTENKAIRSRVMEELVSHYISSLSRTPDDENDLIAPNSAVTSKTEEVLTTPIEDNQIHTESKNNAELQDINQTDNFVETLIESDDTVLISDDIMLPESLEFEDKEQDSDDSQIVDTSLFASEQEEYDANDDTHSFIIPMTPYNKLNEETISDSQLVVEETQSEEVADAIKKIKADKSKNTAKESQETIKSKKDVQGSKTDKKATKTNVRNKRNSVSKLLIILFATLLIVVAFLAYILIYLPSLDSITAGEYLKEVFACVRFGGHL